MAKDRENRVVTTEEPPGYILQCYFRGGKIGDFQEKTYRKLGELSLISFHVYMK